MYALLYDDSKDVIGYYATKPRAISMARMISRDLLRPIVCIYNVPDGGTTVCFKFERGEQTFDGGCCPSAWANAIADAVVTPDI